MQTIDCRKCAHFFVTWQPNFPYGCRFFGFKGRTMPSQTVFLSSGTRCDQFAPQEPGAAKKAKIRDRSFRA
ncbi:MAG: uracil-DNA glycosylase [Helicobacteraceae bacterium]|nr:uracil-DNA glycosylase [Helicobacteraceae bacterium]